LGVAGFLDGLLHFPTAGHPEKPSGQSETEYYSKNERYPGHYYSATPSLSKQKPVPDPHLGHFLGAA
jgi:hypothetical protein